MRYLSLGDTHEIAASCHYLEVGGTGIILDAGMDPDKDGFDALPPFELIKSRSVDHIVVTHAHHDHLGSLPVLTREVPHARVHTSRATAMLADILLPSSARLQKRRVREGSTTTAPIFDVETAEALGHIYETHNLEAAFSLKGEKAQGECVGEFFHASHVLGAVGVLIDADEKGPDGTLERVRVFYTSDTHLGPQTILPGADFPEDPVDVLLLESTLGADPDAAATTRKAEEQRFTAMLKTVVDRRGVALVPVFALGRSQDVLNMIDRAKQRGQIPKDTPVYTAGSMRAIAEIYDKTRESTPRLDPDFEVYGVDQQRVPRSQARIGEAISKPGIFVVSSGMLFERTPSFALAERLISDERHAILFVGYSKEGAPGDRLQLAAKAGEPMTFDEDKGPVEIKASVERYRFSGHSHRDDLVSIVAKLDPETVVLVHGETAAKEWMRDTILEKHPDVRVIIPGQGEEIDL